MAANSIDHFFALNSNFWYGYKEVVGGLKMINFVSLPPPSDIRRGRINEQPLNVVVQWNEEEKILTLKFKIPL